MAFGSQASGIRNLESGFWIQDAGFRIHDSRFTIQLPGLVWSDVFGCGLRSKELAQKKARHSGLAF
ncbi:MAG: hypothetical protein QF675_12940 [SAR324 cluster bacterium]|nr:hypothetical protein [SAR324 cluster bacterium]